MRTVACFGHSFCPAGIRPALEQTIKTLTAEDPDTCFLVGHQGEFDGMVYSVLRQMENQAPQIRYQVVLAYMPGVKHEYDIYPPERTIYPEGLETVPLRFAIDHRNRWMVRACDMVLCYITHDGGGAAKFVRIAEKQGKRIIKI